MLSAGASGTTILESARRNNCALDDPVEAPLVVDAAMSGSLAGLPGVLDRLARTV